MIDAVRTIAPFLMLAATLAGGSGGAAAAADPGNTLYLDLGSGRVVIEMRPDLAPGHVARIKELARAGFYDGLKFHRVIEGFMAQTGDPRGDGTGGSGIARRAHQGAGPRRVLRRHQVPSRDRGLHGADRRSPGRRHGGLGDRTSRASRSWPAKGSTTASSSIA